MVRFIEYRLDAMVVAAPSEVKLFPPGLGLGLGSGLGLGLGLGLGIGSGSGLGLGFAV